MINLLQNAHLDKRDQEALTNLSARVKWVIEKLEQSMKIMMEKKQEIEQALKAAQQLSIALEEMNLSISSFEVSEVTKDIINYLLDHTYIDEAYEEVLELDETLDQLWEDGFIDDSDSMVEEIAAAISHLSDCFVSCGDKLKKTRDSEDIDTIIQSVETVIAGFKEMVDSGQREER
jgi:hypothetical protein